MKRKHPHDCESEHDFALIVGGVPSLDSAVLDALFKAGCDDATFTIRYGLLYADFSRTAPSLKEAILSAIKDIKKASVGAEILRVDDCDLVTQADIARRIDRTRQMVGQYVSGERGPGNFPPPECHLSEGAPLWRWCAVSWWMAQNNIIRPDDGWNAQAVAIINEQLQLERQRRQNPALVKEISRSLAAT